MIYFAKKSYYKNFFSTHKANSAKTWEGIKKLVSLKNKSKSSPTSLEEQGRIINSPKEIADAFVNFFNDIGINIPKIFQTHQNLLILI